MWNPFRKNEPEIDPEYEKFKRDMARLNHENDALLRGEKNPRAISEAPGAKPLDFGDEDLIAELGNIEEDIESGDTELFAEANTLLSSGKSIPPEETGIRQKKEPSSKDGKTAHELVLQYAPEYLDEGGENIVYGIPGRPDIVVKASRYGMFESLTSDPSTVRAESVGENKVLKQMKREISKDSGYAKTRRELVEYFGRKHVTPQKKFLIKVPVTPEELDDMRKRYATFFGVDVPDAEEAWTYVTVQRREKFGTANHASANVGNLEHNLLREGLHKNKNHMQTYRRLQSALVWNEGEITNEEIVTVINTYGIRMLAIKVKQEPSLKAALKDFVEKAIRYAGETGEIIDIAGRDNISFIKEKGEWTYKLLDPVYPFEDQVLEKSRRYYAAKPDSAHESNVLLQGINFVRGLNALAQLSGSEKRLEFLPASLRREGGDLI